MSARPFEIRDDLRDLPPYRAPQMEAGVRLNTNESPYPPPDAFIEELTHRIPEVALNRYPDRDARALRAGVVWVNCFDKGDITAPFGGFKQSGFGRDKSIHALEKYTDVKSIWIAV